MKVNRGEVENMEEHGGFLGSCTDGFPDNVLMAEGGDGLSSLIIVPIALT